MSDEVERPKKFFICAAYGFLKLVGLVIAIPFAIPVYLIWACLYWLAQFGGYK